LPPQVLAELEEVFRTPVIEAYGMTEAAHQVASTPLPPRPRKAGSVGLAAGPEIAFMDEEGNLLRGGEVGEVVIRGPNVTSGYENNPAANAGAFIRGWFRTGDQGVLDAEGYVFLRGRLKEVINRGGEKISPREVDEVLLSHPAVAQAVTFAVPHPTLGEDVAAAVVPREGALVTEAQLREFAAGRVAHFKVPRQVVFLAEVPKGPTGKVQRIGLAERLGITTRPRPPLEEKAPFCAPRTPVEEVLASLWGEVLGLERVGVHDHFLDAGGDSLLATRLLSRVCDRLQLELPLTSFFDAPTVADQAVIVEQILLDEAQPPGEQGARQPRA